MLLLITIDYQIYDDAVTDHMPKFGFKIEPVFFFLRVCMCVCVYRDLDDLESLTDYYQSVVDQLKDTEYLLMSAEIQKLRSVISNGCKRLTLNSAGINNLSLPHLICFRE